MLGTVLAVVLLVGCTTSAGPGDNTPGDLPDDIPADLATVTIEVNGEEAGTSSTEDGASLIVANDLNPNPGGRYGLTFQKGVPGDGRLTVAIMFDSRGDVPGGSIDAANIRGSLHVTAPAADGARTFEARYYNTSSPVLGDGTTNLGLSTATVSGTIDLTLTSSRLTGSLDFTLTTDDTGDTVHVQGTVDVPPESGVGPDDDDPGDPVAGQRPRAVAEVRWHQTSKSCGIHEVSLLATASEDPDGEIVAFEWLTGGEVVGEGDTLHLYLWTNLETVTLRVTDDDGLTDSHTFVLLMRPVDVEDQVEEPTVETTDVADFQIFRFWRTRGPSFCPPADAVWAA